MTVVIAIFIVGTTAISVTIIQLSEIDVVEEDGTVKVRLTGACGTCPMAAMTLRFGVEKILKEQVPEVKEVVTV